MSETKPKRPSTQKRHQKVLESFQYQFEVKRLRYDDAIQKVAEEFDYSTATVERIVLSNRG